MMKKFLWLYGVAILCGILLWVFFGAERSEKKKLTEDMLIGEWYAGTFEVWMHPEGSEHGSDYMKFDYSEVLTLEKGGKGLVMKSREEEVPVTWHFDSETNILTYQYVYGRCEEVSGELKWIDDNFFSWTDRTEAPLICRFVFQRVILPQKTPAAQKTSAAQNTPAAQ